MALHLIKLCVGAESLVDLQEWVKKRSAQNRAAGLGRVHDHVTRMFPKRDKDLLEGGSIFWVIKGVVLARQRLLRLERVRGVDGVERCAIIIEPSVIATQPQPRRAFQGWRYLKAEEAPPDLGASEGRGAPPELNMKLAELGLL